MGKLMVRDQQIMHSSLYIYTYSLYSTFLPVICFSARWSGSVRKTTKGRPFFVYLEINCFLGLGSNSLLSTFQRLDFTPFNPLANPDFCFYDEKLLESVKVGDLHTHEFFRLLSLCHTVMSEEKSEGEQKEVKHKQQLAVCLWLPVLFIVFHLSTQESWSIRHNLQMRALWWRQLETLDLCFALEHLERLLRSRWAEPSPTRCSPYWTSTTSARGCLL